MTLWAHVCLYFALLLNPFAAQMPEGGITGGSGGGGGPTFTYVTSAITFRCTNVTTTPCVVTFTPTNTGDLVTVDFQTQDNGTAGTATVSDGSSSSCTGISTYATAYNHKDVAAGGNITMGEFYTLSVGSGVTDICVTPNTSTNAGMDIIVQEHHRTSGSWALDQVSASASGTGIPQTAGSITTTANPVDVQFIMGQTTDTTHAFTGASGYTVRQQDHISSMYAGSGDQIFTATGTYAGATTTGASVSWIGYTVSYK